MMSLSSVAKRPVQQAVVASHVAAESYHEGSKRTQWDVWLARSPNHFTTYFKHFQGVVSYKSLPTCPASTSVSMLQVFPSSFRPNATNATFECPTVSKLMPVFMPKIFPNSSLSSVLSYCFQSRCSFKLLFQALLSRINEWEDLTRGEFGRFLPEALAKFPNSPLSSQLRIYNQLQRSYTYVILLSRAPLKYGLSRLPKMQPIHEQSYQDQKDTADIPVFKLLAILPEPPECNSVNPCQPSKQLSACSTEELSAHQMNVQTTSILSFLTPTTMMSLSFVAKRPVQQAMVASHVAAESYHEGYKGT